MKSLSRVLLLATPWTAAYQAPPSMGFSRQEYWSGVSLPSPAKVLHEPKFLPPLQGSHFSCACAVHMLTSFLFAFLSLVTLPPLFLNICTSHFSGPYFPIFTLAFLFLLPPSVGVVLSVSSDGLVVLAGKKHTFWQKTTEDIRLRKLDLCF